MADLYRGNDPRLLPAYPLAEAAHYLHVSGSTLRSWTLGRPYDTKAGPQIFEPVIHLPTSKKGRLLSFTNLVEAHVLAALRKRHGVKLPAIRDAVDHLRQVYGVTHPLADARFKTDGISLFIERLDQLIDASRGGQVVIKEVMEAYLKRVEHDREGLAARLFPFTRDTESGIDQPLSVVIDPRISFGRPVLVGTGIPTSILADRYKAGESMQDLADDYECDRDQIEEAIRCELPAAA